MAGEFLNPSDFDDFDFNAGSFVAGSNSILPGVMDEPVQCWQKGDLQEELVVEDTRPGPPSGVAAKTGCPPRSVEGTGGESGCENTFENASRVKLVPTKSVAGGSRAASRFVNGSDADAQADCDLFWCCDTCWARQASLAFWQACGFCA